MTQLLIYLAAGILSLLYYAAVLQLFRIARVLEEIRDQKKATEPSFKIKGGIK